MLVVLLCCFVSRAQTVGYSYKPLAAEGCSMKYSVTRQDSVLLYHCHSEIGQIDFLERVNNAHQEF